MLSRCCCAPQHSIIVKFYHVGKDAPELKPGQRVDWSYEPQGEAFMSFEREGCDCCFTGPCPKPCICCFACSEGCQENGTVHAGELTGAPGSTKGNRERAKLIGESVQPPGGGGFKPIMQMMDRADPDDPKGETEIFSATRGPCCTGGMSKLCFDAAFNYASVSPDMANNSSKLHTASFGDFASVTKLKPAEMKQGIREFFTDSDLFDVKFVSKEVSPQQKANILAQMVHLDYMFFERDGDICKRNSDGSVSLVFANCFIYGCVCPCQCTLSGGES